MGIIALLTVMGIYSASAFITSTFLTRRLIAEEKFHLLTDDNQIRVVAGKRRKPMQISEAEKHLSTIRAVSRSYRWKWPLALFRLYGPKQMVMLDTDLDKIRKQAIESQQASLRLKAMDKGYDGDPIMLLIEKASTDESFKILEDKIHTGEFGIPVAITADEAKVSTKPRNHRDSEPIVLMNVSKNKIAKKGSVTAADPSKRIFARGAKDGVSLPEGYSWDLGLIDKGSTQYEKMNVILRKNGEKVRSLSFYTDIWGTPDKQKAKINELQRALATSAHHDSQGGVDKNFLR